jgi:hypothetical protein
VPDPGPVVTSSDDRETDPGWPWRQLLLAMVPFPIAAKRQAAAGDFLVVMRLLFFSFAGAVVSIGVVSVFLTGTAEGDVGITSAVVVGVGLVALAIGVAVDRPLDCSSEVSLLVSYRSRLFVRIAFGEVGALVGFVGVVFTGELVVYVAGAAVTALGFTRAAPSARNLARDQEQLSLAGCPYSLTASLREPRPPEPPPR